MPSTLAGLRSGASTDPSARSRAPLGVLAAHVLAVTLIQSTFLSVQTILSILVRKRFEAANWQTLLVTAAPTALFVVSIFWNDLFGRMPLRRYLWVFWLASSLPLALIAEAQNYWMVLIPHLIACVGAPGYYPVAGELFKRLYPERSRGRAYSLIWGASMVGGVLTGLVVGRQMDLDGDAFRWIMPVVTLMQLAGVIVLEALARLTAEKAPRPMDRPHGHAPPAEPVDARRLARLLDPILHMRQVLRADPVFFRYEAAYMTYGVGWMIAAALLPLLATDKLHLRYDQYTQATQVAYQIAIVAMIWPAGWLMDRLGTIRSVGLSFGLLALYPAGLIFAGDAAELTIASVVYGVAHAGASVGWMLGPVALAPTPAKAPQYVAIHATLVGLRGSIFQGVGVALYSVTGSFTWPLLVAVAAYLWSAVQMWRLERLVRAQRAAAHPTLAAGPSLAAGAPQTAPSAPAVQLKSPADIGVD